jgi:hypothetical protein
MAVFPHQCLPLTANVKKHSRGSLDKENAKTLEDSFKNLLTILLDAVRRGIPPKEEMTWDYDYVSLWSPLLRGEHGKINIWRCKEETFIGLLRSRTYWYKRLPKNSRNKIKKVCVDRRGRRFLKDVLDTADGVITSLIFSFPEMFLDGLYEVSDRIISSVISNCLASYSKFQKQLKSLRKIVKYGSLNQKEIPIDYDNLRNMSYMIFPLRAFNGLLQKTSKSKMFRVAMFCQTRASGLAGQAQIQETIKEFLDTVTVKRTFLPNSLLLECIELVTDELAQKVQLGINPEFKISMSTSACRESSQKKEGKFGYLKALVRADMVKIPRLSEGIPGTLGNWLYPIALNKLENGDESVMKVNVAAIRENAKCRVVTSGSFWKDIALQPYSHITIHLLKTLGNIRDGLQAGRLGWRFISQLEFDVRDRNGYNWIFDPKVRKFIYTTDWKKATDGPTPESGWATTGRLLEKLGLPEPYLKSIKKYWLGEKKLYMNGKLIGILVNGIPMGDPLTKTNLSLAHPICDLYAKIKTGSLSIERGCGDDTAAFCSTREYAFYHNEAAVMLGYERSELDESLSETWGTYAEEYFAAPLHLNLTPRWANRFKDLRAMPYLDIPKIRVMIATEKDREDFSSDPRGKVTLLGHDQEYLIGKNSEGLEAIFSIASAFQDICLATIDRPEPLFLPRQVNGVGKAPPYWNIDSYCNILKHCRIWHRKYYMAIMKEINEGRMDISSYRGALKESSHFKKEMMVELFEIPKDDPIKKHIVVPTSDWEVYPVGVLDKLITLGYLVPESKISKYYLFQERLEQLEQDTHRDLFEVVKARMIDYPEIETDRSTIETFVKSFKASPYLLRSRRFEPLYFDTVLKELRKGDPLVVTSVDFPLIEKFKERLRPSTPYEVDGYDLFEWFVGAWISRRNGIPIDTSPPTKILEDDPIILRNVNDGGSDIYVIITDDRKLFRLCQNKLSTSAIIRVPCAAYSRVLWSYQSRTMTMTDSDAYDLMQEEMCLRIKRYFGKDLECTKIVDSGSYESYIAQTQVDKDSKRVTKLRGVPWTKDWKRENVLSEIFSENYESRPQDWEGINFPESFDSLGGKSYARKGFRHIRSWKG